MEDFILGLTFWPFRRFQRHDFPPLNVAVSVLQVVSRPVTESRVTRTYRFYCSSGLFLRVFATGLQTASSRDIATLNGWKSSSDSEDSEVVKTSFLKQMFHLPSSGTEASITVRRIGLEKGHKRRKAWNFLKTLYVFYGDCRSGHVKVAIRWTSAIIGGRSSDGILEKDKFSDRINFMVCDDLRKERLTSQIRQVHTPCIGEVVPSRSWIQWGCMKSLQNDKTEVA